MVLKPGWLNRQFDQVSKNVDSWPEWMKRAAGVEESCPSPKKKKDEPKVEARLKAVSPSQERFNLL